MNTYVLVPGAWLGKWAWESVAEHLVAEGHTVYPRTLPGLADRAKEAKPSLSINDYVSDISSFIEENDLKDVVLVGHSFGAAVVGGVSQIIPARLSHVVYVDSGPMADGVAYIDFLTPEQREFVDGLIEERGEGWKLPKPTWDEMAQSFPASTEGLDQEQLNEFERRATPQPVKTWTDSLQTGEAATSNTLPKTSITCSLPLQQLKAMIESGNPWFTPMSGPEWTFIELPTGHWPMFSRPKDLAQVLSKVENQVAPVS